MLLLPPIIDIGELVLASSTFFKNDGIRNAIILVFNLFRDTQGTGDATVLALHWRG
jgi:hypothetical protein